MGPMVHGIFFFTSKGNQCDGLGRTDWDGQLYQHQDVGTDILNAGMDIVMDIY